MPSPPEHMTAVVLEQHGGPSSLVIRDKVPVPKLEHKEVLVRVAACGVNNTDINTRLGWYDSSVRDETGTFDKSYDSVKEESKATWGGNVMSFPRIQGADIVGYVVALGSGVDKSWMGCRVIADPVLRESVGELFYERVGYIGSERDGGFGQFVSLPVRNLERVQSDWTDVELATLPCSYTTAENMLDNAEVCEKDVVLVTGSSGGVGSALVMLAKRRGAKVIALTSANKAGMVSSVGADAVIRRGIDDWESVIMTTCGRQTVSVVADVVGAPVFKQILNVLARGGRYVTSGAIGGKMVEIDLSLLYLRDWRLIGCTVPGLQVFSNILKYVERGDIAPLVAGCFPLDKIHEVQELFGKKTHFGSYVLVPPPVENQEKRKD